MRLKEPPISDKLPVSTFLLHREWYKIDYTYQREAGTWGLGDEQYFVDTILRGLGMPPIFIHKKGNGKFIVDGQQRLNTIWRFKDGKIELGERYSADIIKENDGSGKYDELKKGFQQRFDEYPIPIIYLEGYSDEEIRDMFRRLQAGKPLTVGERLNAYAGQIVPTMRTLGSHRFFSDIIPLKLKRYRNRQLAAIFMYLEHDGIKDISPRSLYEFFIKYSELGTGSNVYRKVVKVLNYLVKAFKEKTGQLDKGSWIVNIYLLTSHLMDNYVMRRQENNLKEFLKEFYNEVWDAEDSGDKELVRFDFANSSGTTSEKNIKTRYNIMLRRFIEQYNPQRLDEERLFSHKQKLDIYNRDGGVCQICSRHLAFGNSKTHYHHKDKFIEGGRTQTEKGLLVCRDCHLREIHGKISK